MKTTFLITASFLLLNIYLFADSENKYRSDEGKVSITFPVSYTVTEETKDYGKFVSVTATQGSTTYMLSYTLHHKELTNHDELSEYAMKEFAKTIKGKIKDVKPFKYHNNVGKKALIIMKKEKVKIKYISLIIGQIQYQLVVIAPIKEDIDEKTKKFVDTLYIDRE